jgi:iron complex transport system ATP-binding protein
MKEGAAPLAYPPPGENLRAWEVTVPGSFGRHARLERITWHVAAGKVAVVAGPNGAGKSTLLRCLAGLLRPAQGRVEVGEVDLYRLPPAHRARKVTLVGAASAETGLTVQEVVALGRLAHRPHPWQDPLRSQWSRVEEALRQWDLWELRQVPYSSLSSGERQRVRLARAFAQDTPFLLLDEPTAFLDPGHAQAILHRLLHVARQGRGVAVALHDLTTAGQLADEILLLAAGRMVAWGPPVQVLEPGLLASVYGAPMRVLPHPDSGRPVVVPSLFGIYPS